ncbi:MAG: Crp/Fnr family transcriptional regulator [Xanthobacteraceae bacterium]
MTCPRRELEFCGAILRQPAAASSTHAALDDWQHRRTLRPGEVAVAPDQTCPSVLVLCSGWAFRFVQLQSGRRQILNFLLAGDLFSCNMVFQERCNYYVKALTDIQITELQRSEVIRRIADDPSNLTALAKCCATEAATADGLLAVVAQGSAEQRIAYLFLHLMQRIESRSVIRDQRYQFPLRQQHIADAVGLTVVHVNRVLSLFRKGGILDLSHGVLQVFNLPELKRLAPLK